MGKCSDYKGIWVFVDHRQCSLQEVTLELIGKSRELAKKTQDEVTAVLLGDNVEHSAQELIEYGADNVLIVENPHLKDYQTDTFTYVMEKLVKKYKPSILLFGATSTGRDLAPRLATRIKTGLSADCIDLEVDNDGVLIQTKPSFGGNIMVEILCPEFRPQMATVRPKVIGTPEKDLQRKGNIIKEDVEIDPDIMLTNLIESIKVHEVAEKIEDGKIIIAGGRGMQNKENFDKLYELGEAIGGIVGATRPPVNEGWIGEEMQIGQSGKTVAPKILFCCGISGAVQHVVGIENAEVIIAINKDPNASIFQYADYGIIGDCNKIIPILTQKFREISETKQKEEFKC